MAAGDAQLRRTSSFLVGEKDLEVPSEAISGDIRFLRERSLQNRAGRLFLTFASELMKSMSRSKCNLCKLRIYQANTIYCTY